jgi:hypothetical protein
MQTIIMIASPRTVTFTTDARKNASKRFVKDSRTKSLRGIGLISIRRRLPQVGGLFEVRRAIDTLVEERGRQSGKDVSSSPEILTLRLCDNTCWSTGRQKIASDVREGA